MRPLTLTEIAQPLGGTLLGEDGSFAAVATDSRSLAGGELFVALSGQHFDGHDYVIRAAREGAVAAIVSRHQPYPLPCLQVADTTRALGHLAALNRSYFDGTLVAITGSNGKTTAKNLLIAIFQMVGPTHGTCGNFNNEVGVPLTLLGLTPEHQFAVVEMGASQAGDIAYLTELARPQVAVLLNAHPAHLKGFGSVSQVAKAKAEIFSALETRGVGVVNADSEYLELWKRELGQHRCISFGHRHGADVMAEEVQDLGAHGSSFRLICSQGQADLQLKLPGRHNVDNALAAAAAALATGVPLSDVVRGLQSVVPAPGRLQVTETQAGALVIDDSYNANPGSVRAAIDVLAATPGRSVLILGAMAELGPRATDWHAEIGTYARARGVDELWLIGAATAAAKGYGRGARIHATADALPDTLQQRFGAGDVVLVKGSRSAGMEVVVNQLLQGQRGED